MKLKTKDDKENVHEALLIPEERHSELVKLVNNITDKFQDDDGYAVSKVLKKCISKAENINEVVYLTYLITKDKYFVDPRDIIDQIMNGEGWKVPAGQEPPPGTIPIQISVDEESGDVLIDFDGEIPEEVKNTIKKNLLSTGASEEKIDKALKEQAIRAATASLGSSAIIGEA